MQTVAGTGALVVYQSLMIFVTAALSNPRETGLYALGAAIASPVLAAIATGMRLVNLRDPQIGNTSARYLGLRALAIAGAGLVLAAGTLIVEGANRSALIIIGVVTLRAVEAIADSIWCFLLGVGRTAQLNRVLTVRAMISIVSYSLLLYVTHDVLLSLWTLAAASAILVLVLDAPARRSVHRECSRPLPEPKFRNTHIIRGTAVLGVATGIAGGAFNVPRYFLQAQTGPSAVAAFSVVASLFVAASLFTATIGQLSLPSLARAYAQQNYGYLLRRISQLITIGTAVVVVLAIATIGVGDAILGYVFGPEYRVGRGALTLICVALLLAVPSTFLQDLATVLCAPQLQVIVFAASAVTTTSACVAAIPEMGLAGAALALSVSSLTQLLGFVYICARRWRELSPA